MPQAVSFEHDEATVQWIAQDIVYFMAEAKRSFSDTSQEPGDHIQKRYARTTILLTAFYLESTSKRFADCLLDPENDWKASEFVNLDGGLAQPIARFRAVHKHCLSSGLSTGLDKVRDIFTIRNKVLAHPKGRSSEFVDDRGSRTGSFSYLDKDNSFPKLGSQFGPDHAEEILMDALEFVERFHDLVADSIGDDHQRVLQDTRRALSTLRGPYPPDTESNETDD